MPDNYVLIISLLQSCEEPTIAFLQYVKSTPCPMVIMVLSNYPLILVYYNLFNLFASFGTANAKNEKCNFTRKTNLIDRIKWWRRYANF